MSFFGNIGNAIKKGVTDVGHFVGKAAANPWVEGGLGLATGGLAAPVIAGLAGGLLKPGGNIGQAVKGGVTGAAAGGAGKLIGGLPGVGSVLGGINNAAKGIPGVSSIENVLGGLKNIPGIGNIGDIAGKIGGAAGLGTGGSSFDPGKIAMLALAAAQIKNNADLQGKADDYSKQALASATGSYNERAPLRAAGIAGMLNPQIADISHLMDNSGPYAKGLLPGLGKPPTVGQGKSVASLSSFT